MRSLLLIALAIIAVSANCFGAEERSKTDAAVHCEQTDDSLAVFVRGEPVLRYHTAVVQPPEGVDPVYRRSGFIHPVHSPAGRVVTADFPLDHVHQHGIFNAWVNTTFEGRKVDFWNQKAVTGDVEHARVVRTFDGEDAGGFTVELLHSDRSAPGGTKPVLRELWTVRVLNVPKEEGRLFEIESRQTCVADSPLTINEYHYGGMAFRGSDQWFAGDQDLKAAKAAGQRFEFLTSEGKDRIEGNHTRPRWVTAHGLIDGEECGITIMCHPGNFRAPQPVRLHPTKPYFVFSPPVLGEFQLEPGVEQPAAKYRYHVFDGPYDAERTERLWKSFAEDPAPQ